MELCLTQSSKFVHAQPLTIVSEPCRNLTTYMFRSSPADLPNRNLILVKHGTFQATQLEPKTKQLH